jgi:preprotein translocase subunit SecA
MATSPENMVQRKLDFAIVDEVDSILIDEARTPLIISAPDAESTKLYEQFASMVPQLKENIHYNIDEKRKAASLTDEGVEKIENMLGIDNLYAEGGLRQVHHIEQALRAQTLFQKDKEYVVQNGQVIIVDEFTGRLMAGRRYSEGLHQAIEAKEGVDVQQESRTLATITFQNFFRLYENLAGMTGTAVTSAEEFEKVYNLDVVVIPTNQALVRNDKTDRIYVNEKAKFRAVVEEIKLRQTKGQPVLVGTIAIEKSEYLSKMLSTAGVKHEVLNAKHHAREAEIISQSGQHGSVTISTNMAGRGTDIKLGEGVIALGGLFVLGTERHEARRIDNQLRGRSGRQGDPGETQFFVSMEDDIMRIFGGDRLKRIMERLKVPEDQPIENKMVSRSLEGAQERVEGHYFDMRKQVLSYDDVLNKQRDAIYTLRRSIMLKNIWKESGQQEDLKAHINQLIKEQADAIVFAHTQLGEPETWNIEEIGESIHAVTNIPLNQLRSSLDSARNQARANGPDTARKKLSDLAKELMTKQLKARQQELGEEIFKKLAQAASLRAIDTHWMDHLDTMDYLRTGIGLRGYGQRDPLVEYQREGYQLFQQLLSTIKSAIVEVIYKAQAVRQETNQGEAHHQSATSPHRIAESIAGEAPNHKPAQHSSVLDAISKDNINSQATGSLKNPYKNVSRNDPCPCGSGKKFKKCHGMT